MVTTPVTRCGEDDCARWMRLLLTANQREMHHRLFGPRIRRAVPASDASVDCALGHLRASRRLRTFRMWLVGSRVQPGQCGSDVDLVLSPGCGFTPDDQVIVDALRHCREYGLYGMKDACVIDPCFRRDGPTRQVVPLPPDTRITTLKLLSPNLVTLVRQGRIRAWRPCGDVGLQFMRRAADTGYYTKLPLGAFAGTPRNYLRPAVEIC
ncbi:MAG: hypothetical protein WCB92_02320 [Mycobacterium sp.]